MALRQESDEAWLVLQRRARSAAPDVVVARRRRVILELVLSGLSENTVALELKLCASTVSHELKQALTGLGLPPRLSAVPLPIAQLYHAAATGRALDAQTRGGEPDEPLELTVLLPRPEPRLTCLAPVELIVCQLLLSGDTHAQIAAKRGRSARTVANQLASVFSKLRVSGRLELVSRLAALAWPDALEGDCEPLPTEGPPVYAEVRSFGLSP